MKNKFNRLISLVLAVVMVSVLVAGCKKNTDTDNNSSDVKTTAETSSNTDSETKDESSAAESVTDTQSTENTESTASTTTDKQTTKSTKSTSGNSGKSSTGKTSLPSDVKTDVGGGSAVSNPPKESNPPSQPKQPTDEENIAKINAEIEKENKKHYYTIDHQVYTATDETTLYVSEAEQLIFKYINIERTKAGVKPLTWNEGIYPYVKQRSIETIQTHWHTRDKAHGYRNWDTVFTDAGIHPTGKIGENLLEVSCWWEPLDDFAKRMVQLWVESPEHYEAMIDPYYKSTAICIYGNVSDNYLYITEIFWY